STTADAAGGRGRATLVCGALARPADARGFPRWARVRVDPHGVRTARAVPAQSASGADAGADHGAGLELRLRADVESARGVHQLPAAEDGGGRGAAPDPYGARGRVRVAGARAVSLRTRLTLAGGGAVFVALAIASLVIYTDVRSKLHDQIDVSLIQSADGIAEKWLGASGRLKLPSAKTASTGARPAGKGRGPKNAKPSNAAASFGKDPSGFFQVTPSLSAVRNGGLSAAGAPARTAAATTTAPRSPVLALGGEGKPILGHDAAVASGVLPPYFRDVRFAGETMRLYTMRLPSSSDGLVRTVRPLTEANATIARVRWLLFSLTLGGALAAGLLGRLAANAVLRPVRALAGAVRGGSSTRDLNKRIPVSGRDELASLTADFNAMLTALDESQQAQQQLIADASHELRTPLTAHRANIELLARPDLPVERRQRVLGAAVRSIEELSALVRDLIQAAR